MKKTLTLLLIACSSVVYGQSKYIPSCDTCRTMSIKGGVTLAGTGNYTFTNMFVIQGGLPKAMLKVGPLIINKNGNIDSVKIYVHKSKLRWLNDSTAVITK